MAPAPATPLPGQGVRAMVILVGRFIGVDDKGATWRVLGIGMRTRVTVPTLLFQTEPIKVIP